MDCKTIENEMFELIREHSKHVEMWWPVKGFDNYQVSTKGRIRNVITRLILKADLRNGYYSVGITNNSRKRKHMRINRLVALTFIPNEDNKPIAEHIDRNPLNNNLINIRWASDSENARNRKMSSSNTSGCTGVNFFRDLGKWVAQIRMNHKEVFWKACDTFEEAKEARIKAVKELFKEFANPDEFK